MSHSSKPSLSFEVGANHLHAVLRVDDIRRDTLTQLVQHWADPTSRDDVIAALDELAEVVSSARREGELDAAVEQVEDTASMDTAQVEVGVFEMRRLRAEAEAVERVTSRFSGTRAGLRANRPPKQGRRTA